MKKALFYLTTILSLLFLGASIVGAQYNGPNSSYSIIIDKMVGRPIFQGSSIIRYDYVDNLTSSMFQFYPQDQVNYRLMVKNTSNVRLYNVIVKDFVPNYLEPMEGPGPFDASTRTITFNAGDFAVDEEKYYYMRMQIYPKSNLPSSQFCIINRTEARNDNTYDDDTSQICVDREGVPNSNRELLTTVNQGVSTTANRTVSTNINQIPSAGDPMGLLMVFGSLITLASGIVLNKKIS
ncbi:MAG: hypothetical protein WCO06_03395 [Candidatus Roizmanbacteria bacterium]